MNKNRGMDMEEQPKRDNTLLIVLMIVAICFLLVKLGMHIAYYQELSAREIELSEQARDASERSERASEASERASEASEQASERLERSREEFKKKWGEYP
ncbi:MAG: hypothetical protein KFW21_05955 [Spirochaetota bacterium]|nr:hypothetical protein [Spirochaetota bacterium]